MMIEETMRNELKDVLDAGYTLDVGFFDDGSAEKVSDHFYFYLTPPGSKLTDANAKNIYGNMQRTKRMTQKEIAYSASYFLIGMLESRGDMQDIREKVTT